MTTLAMTLPLGRRSASSIPRRDIAAALGDNLALHLTIVEADRPDAAPLNMIGEGPSVRLVLYRHPCWLTSYDYGLGYVTGTSLPVASVTEGVVVDGGAGRVNVTVPAQDRTGRIWWQVQVDDGLSASAVAHGVLHLRPGIAAPTHVGLTDEGGAPITDDAFQAIRV